MKPNGFGSWLRGSVTLRIVTVGILGLILLIPVQMVQSVISERENSRMQAIAEISQKWGNSQVIAGPVLTIPYDKMLRDQNGTVHTATDYLHVLPETLAIKGDIEPTIRSRGIYEAVLYTSKLMLTGTFAEPDLAATSVDPNSLKWNEAFVSVGIPDMRGIKDGTKFTWDQKAYSFSPGLKNSDVIRGISQDPIPYYNGEKFMDTPLAVNEGEGSGLSASIPLDPEKTGGHTFSLDFTINGSQELQLIPLGRATDVHITSSWKSPSFNGAFLPEEHQITDKGFDATWKILDLNRNFPQIWSGAKHNIYVSAFGVDLFVPVDGYQKSTRSVKYALLVIVLTFMGFFFSEIFDKKRIHPIQYLLVGLALVLFYSLLVSLSEVLGFDAAYGISAVAVIALISGYSRVILPTARMVVWQAFVLTFSYLFVYTILQLEDYALLAGSLGLFVILATIMYLTRKIDWYAIGE